MSVLLSLIYQRSVIMWLSVTLLSACSFNTQPPLLSDYDLATQYMHDQQYSAAISLLEGRLRQYPTDKQAKFLLAAAYAGRGGVLVIQFIDLGTELDRLLNSQNIKGEPEHLVIYNQLKQHLTQPAELEWIENLEKLHRVLWEVNYFIQFFERLPVLNTPGSLADIEQAVNLLEQLPDLEKGRLVYRGLLKLTVYKNKIKSLNWFQSLLNLDFCNLNLDSNLVEVYQLRSTTQSWLQDLVLGRSQPVEFIKKEQEIKQFINRVFNPLIDFFVLHNSFNSTVDHATKMLGQTCIRN